ncbi:hypothetical protein TSMEX_009388 [Taenia solium]|eukprot:TsM_001217400 transcript=TsM_001217400 gene=TsM_001217400
MFNAGLIYLAIVPVYTQVNLRILTDCGRFGRIVPKTKHFKSLKPVLVEGGLAFEASNGNPLEKRPHESHRNSELQLDLVSNPDALSLRPRLWRQL